MVEITFGISISSTVIAIFIFIVYFVTLLMLGWESHSKYGIGFYIVGACIIGAIAGIFNYKYWGSVQSAEEINYPFWMMAIINFFMALIGLWGYLIYHSAIAVKSKARRSGARLVTRVFAEESAPTGTGKFRDHLQGWEGDIKLDMLIVEKQFNSAEDYLHGIIIKATSEMDNQKARHYEQYKAVISKERLFAEESSEFSDDAGDSTVETKSKDIQPVDLRRDKEIVEDDLPEGWSISE